MRCKYTVRLLTYRYKQVANLATTYFLINGDFMKNKINTNFTKAKVGETLCYHIGLLARDRLYKLELSNVANAIFKKSTAIQIDDTFGTGEFELKQKKLGNEKYAYLAKRIKRGK